VPDTLGDRDLDAQRRAENFPVALRLLPATSRRHLVTVYDVVRVIDDLGDEAAGDRTELLRAFAVDLRRVWTDGRPAHPVLRHLVGTARDCRLEPEPFERLLQANLQDQVVARYPTRDALLGYCALSAAPVGRIVLAVFGVRSPAAAALSDRVCAGLQLLEHWQDVAEDRARGRVYLPLEDMAACGVHERDLDAASSSPALRRLVEVETGFALELLDAGAELVAGLRGWPRLAVAGYVAGGRAAADALRRSGFEVLAGSPRPRRRDVARHLLREVVRR
jgi:squalene synthase HpnC